MILKHRNEVNGYPSVFLTICSILCLYLPNIQRFTFEKNHSHRYGRVFRKRRTARQS